MNQLSIFAPTSFNLLKLYIDGASRGNPGPAGIGICLLENERVLKKVGFFVGIKTNNQAEYLALLVGLTYAQQYITEHAVPQNRLAVFTDSQLLARQVTGHYKVKQPSLRCLYKQAQVMLNNFNYTITHIYRKDNKEADRLANDGINKKRFLPDDMQQFIF